MSAEALNLNAEDLETKCSYYNFNYGKHKSKSGSSKSKCGYNISICGYYISKI